MSQPVFSTGLEEDLVQRVGTKLHLEVTVEDQSEKVFFEWRGPAGSNADDGRIVITETGNTSTAEITPLHLQDQGIWTCSAKNKHGVTQTKCNVLAQVPKSYKAPVFLEELVAGLTDAGTVSLECKVVGIPSPALRWFRDGEEIRSGDVFALQANMERPVSVYRCDAVNCMGTVSSTAVLDVSKSLSSQTKSIPVLTETLIDKKVKIGELVELSIAVSRISLPVRVVWWNHGSQIAVGDKYSVVENNEGRYSVIINPVELCDDGEWKVSVENQFGSASSECTLTLRVPKNYRKPRFVENLKAVLTKEGLVSFECKVVGYPTPVLRWFKDGAELKPGDVYQLSGSRSLGTYSCLARNCMGEAVSTAALTVEDIGEKFPDSKSELRFLVPLQDSSVKIGDKHRFSIQVTYSPCLEIAWRHKEVTVGNNERVSLSKEDGGFYHCDINQALLEDEGQWSVIAKDSGHEIDTKCLLSVTVPKHYKKPKFLEPLKAVLTEEGAVNLECKVIGVPQPTLSWYKDGVELKAGDIHRLMSGKDGSCCLGTYTCVATNCMGSVTSSAALLGFEDAHEQEHAIAHDLQTPDISDGNLKPFSLSTIQEERTSQMMSPEAAQITETLRQQSLDNDDQISIISMGKVDQDGELSLSIGNQEVTLSLYQTPDLSEGDAKNICEMFAEELAESITESKYVELPPLRFTKETAKASNITMEAIIIDIDQQDLEEYESMKMALENIDDLQTECDIEDVSVADWEEPVIGTEFETMTCEEILEFDDAAITCDPVMKPEQHIDESVSRAQESQIIGQEVWSLKAEEEIKISSDISKDLRIATTVDTGKEKEDRLDQAKVFESGVEFEHRQELSSTKTEEEIKISSDISTDLRIATTVDTSKEKEDRLDQAKIFESGVEFEHSSIVLSGNKIDSLTPKPTEKVSKVVGVQKKTEKSKSKDENVEVDISWRGPGDSVMVAGDFNNWQPQEMTKGEDGIWTMKKKLTVGKCNLKFVVDGKWEVSKNMVSITDSEGNLNNQIDVISNGKKPHSTISESSQSTEKCRSDTKSDTKSENSEFEQKETDTMKRAPKVKSKAQSASEVTDIDFKDENIENNEKNTHIIESSINNTSRTEIEKVALQESESKMSVQKEKTEIENTHTVESSIDKTSRTEIEKGAPQESESKTSLQKEKTEIENIKPNEKTEGSKQTLQGAAEEIEKLPCAVQGDVLVQSTETLLADTVELKKQKLSDGTETQIPECLFGEKEAIQEDVTNVPRQKKQSRQESVVDSESLPDIETYDVKENVFLTQQNKDLLSNDDDLDLDEDFEAFKRERRKSSYEETLAGMDPEILKELGIEPSSEEGTGPKELLDLSLLPTETAEDRLSRIEEKASKIVIEEDLVARGSKSRSRSRSRSKSRPPNLDTVMEQKKEEVMEAWKSYGLQPSLDTIKESPSTASMLGVLQGGFSSASVNTVLQGSLSASSVHTLVDQTLSSPLTKEKVDHKAAKSKDRISEEKDIGDTYDEMPPINESSSQLDSNEGEQLLESKHKEDLEREKIQSEKEDSEKIDLKSTEITLDEKNKKTKKPKKKAQRSDTQLLTLGLEETPEGKDMCEGDFEIDRVSNKNENLLKTEIEGINKDDIKPTEESLNAKSIKEEQNKLTKEKAIKAGQKEKEISKGKVEGEQKDLARNDNKKVEVIEPTLAENKQEKKSKVIKEKAEEGQNKKTKEEEENKLATDREKALIKAKEEEQKQKKSVEENIKREQEDEEKLAEKKTKEENEKRKAAQEEKNKQAKEEEEKKITAEKELAESKAKEEEEKKIAAEKELFNMKAAEVEEKRKAAEEEEKRKAAEEQEKRKAAEEEQKRKAVEEEQKRKAAKEEKYKKEKEEEEKKKKETEEKKKAVEKEITERKALEEEEKKIAAEKELAKIKAEEEEKKRKSAEEEEKRKAIEEEQKKKSAAEEKNKKAMEEEKKKIAVEKELAEKKAQEEEEQKKVAENEIKRAEAEKLTKMKATEIEEKRKASEEEKKKRATEEMERKTKADEELAKKMAKEEDEKKIAAEKELKIKAMESERNKDDKKELTEADSKQISVEGGKKLEDQKKMEGLQAKTSAQEKDKDLFEAREEIQNNRSKDEINKEEEIVQNQSAERAEQKIPIEQSSIQSKELNIIEEITIKSEDETDILSRPKDASIMSKFVPGYIEKQDSLEAFDIDDKESLSKTKPQEEEEHKRLSKKEKSKSGTEDQQKETKEVEGKTKVQEEGKNKTAKEGEENKLATGKESAKIKEKEEEEKRKSAEEEKNKKAKEKELAQWKDQEEKKKIAADGEELAKRIAKEEEEKKKSAEEEKNKKAKEEEEKKIAAKIKAKEEEEKRKSVEQEEQRKAAEEERNNKAKEEELAKRKAQEAEKELAKIKAKEDEEKRAAEIELAERKVQEEEQKKKAAEEVEKTKRAEAEELAKKKTQEAEEKRKASEVEKEKKAKDEEEKKITSEKELTKRNAQEEEKKKKAAEKELAKIKEDEEKRKAAEEESRKKAKEEEEEKKKKEELAKKNRIAEEELAKKEAKDEKERQKAIEEEKKKIAKEQQENKRIVEEEQKKKDEEKKKQDELIAQKPKQESATIETKTKENNNQMERTRNIDTTKALEDQQSNVEDIKVKKRKDEKRVNEEKDMNSEKDKRKSLSISEAFEESSSEDLITITDDIPSTREISRMNTTQRPQRLSSSKVAENEKNKASAYMPDNITLDKTSYQAESYSSERAGKYEAESRKKSGISSHYSTQDCDRSAADYSASRYKTVTSPVMDHYKAKDAIEHYSSSSQREAYRESTYNVPSHKPPTPDLHRYDNISVSKDIRDSRLSPTYDSRSRNISGDVHYKDTVEKSLHTSQNLMSVVTGSLTQKQEQPKTRRTTAAAKQPTKKVSNEPSKEAAQRKKMELEKNSVAGAVTDIMIKEVGSSWVSLCWKKPSVNRGNPVITYKMESWLCGEGAFWVELGRTPIPQFDAFNLKANKCYHFRVTARNKQGWGNAIMTTHKVDLSKPTQMPVITSDMDPIIKALKDSSVRLSIQVSGEPAPKVTWQKDSIDASNIPGVTVEEDDMGSHVEISVVDVETIGKYTVTAANLAGRTTKSVLVQSVENVEVYEAYKKFKKWQSLIHSPLAPYMVNGPRDRRIQVGQSIQLTCRVVSNPWPVVKWFKEDEPIVADDYTNIYNEADFQHVQVDDVTIDHCGKYCVEAFNEHGSIRSHFTVIVDNGLDRYMPPFFTKELKDAVIHQGCNLLLHCRVESYPYIGVTWHQSGSKIRLRETDYKLIDDDGNVVLVLFEVQRSHNFNCTIMNEVAENSTACQVVVNAPNQPLVQIDEDVIRHSMGPRFVSWPKNQEVVEGSNVTIECSLENCSTLIMSRDFLPKSIDDSLIKFTKVSGNTWSAVISDISTDSSGLYFITARNSSTEEKYPLIIKVRSNSDLSEVTECALDEGVGAPSLSEIGPVFARDADDVIIKTNIRSGQAPFAVNWTLNGKAIVWSNRVSPYNRPGCIGIKILRAGVDDEGRYSCSVQNSAGQAHFGATLLVDYAEQKESELMEELCNCPMLDSITPMMSWSNTPIGTPRRTPLPTPHATPLLTPRATPGATPSRGTTPRLTPRATPSRGTPSLPRRSYGHGDIRSPSRNSNYGDEMLVPPPRKRFVQAPEIFSSFSSKQVDEGSSVELKVFISCAPLTTTTWEKDNLPLMSNNQMMLSEKTGVRTLILHCAKLGDAGAYRMTITNSSGVTSCTAILTVKKKSSGSSNYYASSQLSVPRSPYSSLGRSSLGRSSSSYSSSYSNSYSSYRSYL